MNDDIVPLHCTNAQPGATTFAAVPQALRNEKVWLLWNKEPHERDPTKFLKVPYYANGRKRRGRQASDNDREQLVTFDEAVHALERSKHGFAQFAGVGVASLPGAAWSALDLDNVDRNAEAKKLADIVASAGGYVERSPSGKGLRGFVATTGLGSHKNHALGIEIFEGSGFVTVTGDVIHPGDIVPLPHEVVSQVRGLLGNKSKVAAIERTPPPEWSKLDLSALPQELRTELERGYAEGDDRSQRLYVLCCKLARAGFSREFAFSVVGDPDLPWLAPGLDRRNGDVDRARDWVWRYAVQSAFAAEEARHTELEEAKRIGAGQAVAPSASPPMTLEEMLARFVYLSKTNEICDLSNPRLAMGLDHFAKFTASSITALPNKDNPLKPRYTATSKLYIQHDQRPMLEARTWHPGEGQFTRDPLGLAAVNIWTPTPPVEPPVDWQQRLQPFLAHVAYLVPVESERERLLDWLAHIQQRPGEPVHSHYLMIAPGVQGIGRNWLACLLARVWSGATALSVSLVDVLSGKFNEELSQKLLAVVDELHEGSAGSQWALAESMKSELTRTHRKIKPKYGKEHIEFNCLRWLMFSNHLMALPLTDEDRRIWVIENPRVAREPEYYERLYALLDDAAFVLSVRHWLAARSLSRFRPGERPIVNEAKRSLINSVVSDEDLALQQLMETWGSDCIAAVDLQRTVFGGVADFGPDSAKRRAMLKRMLAKFGAEAYPKTVSINGKNVRVTILRNVLHWRSVTVGEIADEVIRGGGFTAKY